MWLRHIHRPKDYLSLSKHPNYKYTSDYDKKNELDIERFLSHHLKLKLDDAYEVYQVDLSSTTQTA